MPSPYVPGDLLSPAVAVHTPGAHGLTTPAPYRTRLARRIGAVCSPPGVCPSSTDGWLNYGVPALGPLESNKIFYSAGQRMTTFLAGHSPRDQESLLPPAIKPMICYTASQAPQIAAYLTSIPASAGPFTVIFDQECENARAFATPAAFLQAFATEAAKIRALPNAAQFTVAQCSTSYPYRVSGSPAALGRWISPDADLHLIDIYAHATSPGLATDPRFQNWLSAVHAVLPHSPLTGIAEYGIDATCDRPAVLAADASYILSSALKLEYFQYWWSDCSAGVLATAPTSQNQFTDAATTQLFASLLAGTF